MRPNYRCPSCGRDVRDDDGVPVIVACPCGVEGCGSCMPTGTCRSCREESPMWDVSAVGTENYFG